MYNIYVPFHTVKHVLCGERLQQSVVTRGHAFKVFKRQNTHCVRADFFSERVINSLPDSVDFSSFTTFRRTVKQVDFQDFSDINSPCDLKYVIIYAMCM